jgi:tetratricopeptide (TPR) repeat protein
LRLVASFLLLAAAAAADAIDAGRPLLGGPDHEDGVALIREGIAMLEKEPASGKSLHRIGLGYFYLEDDAKAQAAFAKAAALEPKSPEHVFMLAVCQMYSDPSKATATMRKAIGLDPKDARFRFELGRLLAREQHPEEALASFLEACRLDPDHAEAHSSAATLLVAAGKDDEALAHLARAVEIDPQLVDAWYNAGQVHYNHARFERALEAWTRACELAPDDFETRTKLVQALYALGRYDAAAPHRKRVLELKPKDRKEFCFDQFDVGENRVFAYETFDATGDLYYLYTFKVTSPKGEILETVNLESSAIIRENGILYVLGRNRREEHRTYEYGWAELPAYADLKALVIKAAKGELDRD